MYTEFRRYDWMLTDDQRGHVNKWIGDFAKHELRSLVLPSAITDKGEVSDALVPAAASSASSSATAVVKKTMSKAAVVAPASFSSKRGPSAVEDTQAKLLKMKQSFIFN